jgi:hypothetical protein
VKVPLPLVDQVPEFVTVTVPLKDAFGDDLQITWSTPAFTVGALVILTVITEVTARHCPLPVVLNVNVTVPALISAALGVYVAFNVFAFGEKVPVPDVVHVPPVLPPEIFPFRLTAGLLAHTD